MVIPKLSTYSDNAISELLLDLSLIHNYLLSVTIPKENVLRLTHTTFWPQMGLCGQVAQRDMLREMLPFWDEYTGDMQFPVPAMRTHTEPHRNTPEYAYQNYPKYLGNYGEARKRLLVFLIETLKEESARRVK